MELTVWQAHNRGLGRACMNILVVATGNRYLGKLQAQWLIRTYLNRLSPHPRVRGARKGEPICQLTPVLLTMPCLLTGPAGPWSH